MLSKSSFVMSFVQPLDNTWSAGVKDDVAFSGGGNPPEEGRALLFAMLSQTMSGWGCLLWLQADDAAFESFGQRGGAVSNAELVENMEHVALDGGLAHP